MKCGAHFSRFAVSFSRHPSTAELTEIHFKSPAERSRIQTRNLMYYNRASVIIWACASEI